jgi:hypothetical protein
MLSRPRPPTPSLKHGTSKPAPLPKEHHKIYAKSKAPILGSSGINIPPPPRMDSERFGIPDNRHYDDDLVSNRENMEMLLIDTLLKSIENMKSSTINKWQSAEQFYLSFEMLGVNKINISNQCRILYDIAKEIADENYRIAEEEEAKKMDEEETPKRKEKSAKVELKQTIEVDNNDLPDINDNEDQETKDFDEVEIMDDDEYTEQLELPKKLKKELKNVPTKKSNNNLKSEKHKSSNKRNIFTSSVKVNRKS